MSCPDNTCDTTSVLIPGPPGPPGAAGTNGTNGVNAFTTADSFVMPAEGGTVTITVGNSMWMGTDQLIWIKGGAAEGYFLSTAMPSSTTVTIKNIKNTPTQAYMGNVAPGTVFPNLSQVVPAGQQGPAGSPGGGALLIANNLSDLSNVVNAQSNLGLGSAANRSSGVLINELPPIDTTFTNGDSVWATGAGIQTKTAALARAALSLGTAYNHDAGNLLNEVPVVTAAGGLVNGEAVFATGAGLESKNGSAARAALGISAGLGDMLLYQYREADGVDGSAFNSGAWQTVPLNTEVVDTGNHGTIAANNVTLDAGTYRYRFGVVGRTPGAAKFVQGRLYNVSDAVVIGDSYGSVAYDSAGQSTIVSLGSGRFTIASSKTVQLQGQITTSGLFGKAGSFGGGEVYSWWELTKE